MSAENLVVDVGLPTTTRRSSTLVNAIEDSPYLVKSGKPSDEWAVCVHPQGWIYFRNTPLKVVTDQDVRDPETLELVERALLDYPIGALDDGMEVHLCHVHIQHLSTNAPSNLFNLAINHNSCIASYELEDVLPESVQLLTPSRLNRCRRFYWNYLWTHPSHTPIPDRAMRDATDALTWFYTDNLILGGQSTIPFSKDECEELSSMLKSLDGPHNENSTARIMFLAWFLREVASFRASESYGNLTVKEANAMRKKKLSYSVPSHRQPSRFSLLILNVIINCIFFGIPHTYWAHIKSTSEYRGRLADVQNKWEKYIERLVREYSHFLLISTVLLSATVGFMSIDNITEGARLAASISALTSMSSIIIGVFSIWRHQANTSRKHSYTYMHNIQQSFLGVPGHAILLGLPPSLLVWAIVGFTVAIVAYIVEGVADANLWGKISAWSLLAIFVILLGIVLLALYTFSIIWTFQTRTPSLKEQMWGFLSKREKFTSKV